MPSPDLLAKLAAHYAANVDDLFMEAGFFPPDVSKILANHFRDAVVLLRAHFSGE